MRLIKQLVIFLCFFQSYTFAQNFEVLLQKDKIVIGEQVFFTIKYIGDNAQIKNIKWPVLHDTLLDKVEIVDSVIEKNGNFITAKKYLITSFDSGSYVIPQLTLFVSKDSFVSNSFTLSVATVPVDTTKAIKDIKQIKEATNVKDKNTGTFGWFNKYWYLVLIIALLLAFLFYYFFLRRKKEVQQINEPTLPLHEQLLNWLVDIENKNIWQFNIKLYYTELTDVLRTYIEKRYSIEAHEQTSYQLLNNLKTSGMSSDAFEIIKNTLELADMVKFAKASPVGYENQAVMDNAKRFALLTKVSEEIKYE